MSPLSRAVAIAAAGLALLSPSALASQWETPVVVAPATAAGSSESRAPAVVSDPTGRLTSIWAGDGPSGFGVYGASRAASLTGAWSGPVRLSAALKPEAIRVAVNASGQAVAGWVDVFPNGTQHLVTVTRTAAGTWSAPTYFPTLSATYAGLDLAIDPAGRATGIWARSDTNEFGSITQTLGSAAVLSGGPVPAASTADQWPFELSIDAAGNVTALFVDPSELQLLSATRPSGGPWQPPQLVEEWTPTSNDGEFPAIIRPQLAVNASGAAVALWLRHGKQGTEVRASRRAVGGTWATANTLEPASDERVITSVDVGIDAAGRTTAAWSLNVVTELLEYWTEVRSRTAPAGAAWGGVDVPGVRGRLSFTEAPDPATVPAYNAVKLAVGAGGSTVAVWAAGIQAYTTLQSAVRRDTGVWERATTIAGVPFTGDIVDDAAPERLASVAVDPAGRGTIVWAHGRIVRSVSAALATLPVDPAPVVPDPVVPDPVVPDPVVPDSGTAPPTGPSPTNPPTAVPAGGSTPPSAASTKPQATPTSKLVVALYIVPTGRKCPALANGTVAGVRTPLKVKAAKIRGKLRCKVTGVIVLTNAVKAGTKVDVLVTAKGVKRKSVQFPAS